MPLFAALKQELAAAGAWIGASGWVPATSGNYSARIPEGFLITISGKNKAALDDTCFMPVSLDGQALQASTPSAETPVHACLYRLFPQVNVVLHTHSIATTVVSRMSCSDHLVLKQYELLKAFEGITTHAAQVVLPIIENTQDMSGLAAKLEAILPCYDNAVGILLRGHGLYTWGSSMGVARRHLEALEFLIACEMHQMQRGEK